MTESGQTALVLTGTGGVGQAVARTVADASGTVGFTYNSAEETAEQLRTELPGGGHEVWQNDVTDAGETAAVIEDAFETPSALWTARSNRPIPREITRSTWGQSRVLTSCNRMQRHSRSTKATGGQSRQMSDRT